MSWRHRDAKAEAREARRFCGADYPEMTLTPSDRYRGWVLECTGYGGAVYLFDVEWDTGKYMIAKGAKREGAE